MVGHHTRTVMMQHLTFTTTLCGMYITTHYYRYEDGGHVVWETYLKLYNMLMAELRLRPASLAQETAFLTFLCHLAAPDH